jgi:hypothetical protein
MSTSPLDGARLVTPAYNPGVPVAKKVGALNVSTYARSNASRCPTTSPSSGRLKTAAGEAKVVPRLPAVYPMAEQARSQTCCNAGMDRDVVAAHRSNSSG